MNPIFFAGPAEFREWLEENHSTEDEVWVGFYRKDTGLATFTWSEAVDEALCFGWIDGVRRKIDDRRYTNRFTPRRRGSNWSLVNVRKVEALTREGRMRPAGLAAYEARDPDRTGIYLFEQPQDPRLDPDAEARFRADAAAWEFFQAQPPGYRRNTLWWIVSAKREDTRARRLAKVIEESAAGRRL